MGGRPPDGVRGDPYPARAARFLPAGVWRGAGRGRAGVCNGGAEGQLYVGAAFATVVAVAPLRLPGFIHVLLALLAGFVGGALWVAIPPYLPAYRGVSEVVTTLMLNFVGIYLISY